MKIKLVEQSGMSVKALLTRPDLSGGLQLECNIAEDGASHSRRGANYGANQDTNSMAAHLNNEHPEYSRDPLAIKFLSPGPGRASPHMEFVAHAIQRMTHTNLDYWRNRGQG